jgi:hypothetical protein
MPLIESYLSRGVNTGYRRPLSGVSRTEWSQFSPEQWISLLVSSSRIALLRLNAIARWYVGGPSWIGEKSREPVIFGQQHAKAGHHFEASIFFQGVMRLIGVTTVATPAMAIACGEKSNRERASASADYYW